MSSSEAKLSRRALLALIGFSPLVAGCGFRPLYGESGGAADQRLASVRVAPLADRTGQTLHNYLRDRLNPYGQPGTPTYELKVTLTQEERDLGVLEDETASRASMTLTLTYQLLALSNGAPVTQGNSVAIASYDILADRYASQVSKQDALDRALAQLAEDVKLRLATFFASQGA